MFQSMDSGNNQDLFATNLSQTKKIYEMEKQLDYWKEKVSLSNTKNIFFVLVSYFAIGFEHAKS